VTRGKQLKEGLSKVSRRFPVKEIRGTGLMVALEFNEEAPYGTAFRVAAKLIDHGMLLLTCSIFETLRFAPPLVVSASDVNKAVQKIDNVFQDVFGATKAQ